MAEIYRAKTFDAHGTPHLVAVKRVLAHLAEDDDFIQMLVDEAKIASVLGAFDIAIDQMIQEARAAGPKAPVTVVVLTHPCRDDALRAEPQDRTPASKLVSPRTLLNKHVLADA